MDGTGTPIVLYREVLNDSDIYSWCRRNGITRAVSMLHVTIVTVRRAIHWQSVGPLNDDELMFTGPMSIRRLGAKAWCLALDGEVLRERWTNLRDRLPIDYPAEFHAHVTLSREKSFDCSLVYPGEIYLGSEKIMSFLKRWRPPEELVLDVSI